jgi:hypothetical protein
MRLRNFNVKWCILYRPLNTDVPFSESSVKSCCVLHNYMHRKDGVNFIYTLYETYLEPINRRRVQDAPSALDVRNYFAGYFTSPQGSVASLGNMIKYKRSVYWCKH